MHGNKLEGSAVLQGETPISPEKQKDPRCADSTTSNFQLSRLGRFRRSTSHKRDSVSQMRAACHREEPWFSYVLPHEPEHEEHTKMKPQNTICLSFDKEALEAARFYAATFPNSRVTAVHKAPGDFPGGKEGDVLTARRSPSKSPRTIRRKPTATGARSFAMAGRKVSVAGARIAGACPGKSPRAPSRTPLPPEALRQSAPSRP